MRSYTAEARDSPSRLARSRVIGRFYPGRAAELRETNAQDLKATMVIGMRIDEASAKVRAKGVADDEEDYGFPVWAGVSPVTTMIGAAEPCPRLLPGMQQSESLAAFKAGRRLDELPSETQDVYESMQRGDD